MYILLFTVQSHSWKSRRMILLTSQNTVIRALCANPCFLNSLGFGEEVWRHSIDWALSPNQKNMTTFNSFSPDQKKTCFHWLQMLPAGKLRYECQMQRYPHLNTIFNTRILLPSSVMHCNASALVLTRFSSWVKFVRALAIPLLGCI